MRNPVKTAKRQLLRVGSCALSALMVLGSIPAAAIGDGVTATYDEAYYAMTDYYGNLTDGSVVKSYRTNGIATLTDYGDYDEIINLTDGTVPARNGGMTTFRLDEKALPGTFYFEGKTTKPFQQLPWTISMSLYPQRRAHQGRGSGGTGRCGGDPAGHRAQWTGQRVCPEQLHPGSHGDLQSG